MPESFALLPASLDGGWRDAARSSHFRDGHRRRTGCSRAEPAEPSVAILSYEPGAGVPRHRHAGLETIVVLEGTQSDENGDYEAGTRDPQSGRAPSIRCGRRTAASC